MVLICASLSLFLVAAINSVLIGVCHAHTHTHTQVCTSWVPSTFAYHIPQLLICSSLFGEVYLACCVCTWGDAVPVGDWLVYHYSGTMFIDIDNWQTLRAVLLVGLMGSVLFIAREAVHCHFEELAPRF